MAPLILTPVHDSDSDIDMGVAENKDIMSQDESLMDIDSVDSGNRLQHRICWRALQVLQRKWGGLLSDDAYLVPFFGRYIDII